jgi:hypothetical protein
MGKIGDIGRGRESRADDVSARRASISERAPRVLRSSARAAILAVQEDEGWSGGGKRMGPRRTGWIAPDDLGDAVIHNARLDAEPCRSHRVL